MSTPENIENVVVIGSGPAGWTAAIPERCAKRRDLTACFEGLALIR